LLTKTLVTPAYFSTDMPAFARDVLQQVGGLEGGWVYE